MALSEKKHHTSRGQRKDRAGREARDVLHGRVPEALPPQGSRPPCLGEPRWPQERIQQRTVEQLADVVPMVQILDIPVPQLVDQLPDVLRFFATLLLVPELFVEVPKILLDDVPERTAVRETQLAEQLVEVPTIVSYSSLQRTMEQHVDIPVPRRGERNAGLQGFLPGQSSTSRLSFCSTRFSERIVEQIVDIPVSGGGLQDFRPGQSSPPSSRVPARDQEGLDEPGEAVFSNFSSKFTKKVRSRVRTRVRGCPPVSAYPRWRLNSRMRPCWTPSSGSSSSTTSRARPTTGTGVLVCPPGFLLWASRLSGLVLRMRRGSSTAGTGLRVSARMTSLLFLLVMGGGVRGLASPHPILGATASL